MNKIAFISAVIVVSMSSSLGWAHESHSHDAPRVLRAPKGGIIKALGELSVEVVSKDKSLKIYVYDKAMKPAVTSRFKLVASAELPRKKGEKEIKFTAKENYFEGSYDAKGSHRYSLKIAVTDSKTSYVGKMTYTIEP